MSRSAWRWNEPDRTWEIHGRDCWIWMNARPHYCDRGRWLAHVERHAHAHDREALRRLHVDAADNWPRYYFDLERAKAEIEAWLRCRQQWLEEAP